MQSDHNIQKKIALINDYTGFGKCSLAVQLPIISYLGVACAPLPTAILSNHTAYDDYYIDDYTKHWTEYIDKWRSLKLRFEGIYSGFLGSVDQIAMVEDFAKEFLKPGGLVVVDPIMADDGRVYDTYTREMCDEMKRLVCIADVVTPNITEACILTGCDYKEKWTFKELLDIACEISGMGASRTVITGIATEHTLGNFVYEKGKEPVIVRCKRREVSRCGTGDVFSSIIAADCLNGVDFLQSVKRASTFVSQALLKTEMLGMDPRDGIAFEDILDKLKRC